MIVIALDAGHGQDSRSEGVYDSGAEGSGKEEAALAFKFVESALFVAKSFKDKVKIVLTRDTAAESAPLSKRTKEVSSEGAQYLVSIHLNSGPDKATGTETIYRDGDQADRKLALKIQSLAIKHFGLRDRGLKMSSETRHGRLAILEGETRGIPACLLETCFITNASDVEAVFGDGARDNRIAFWTDVFEYLSS